MGMSPACISGLDCVDEQQDKILMQFLECPVCLDGFNDDSHTPRLLCCGHTICQLCVERLVLSSGLPRLCLRCPECRYLSKWRGMQQLPKNYILLKALTSTRTRDQQQVESPWRATSLLRVWSPSILEHKCWELGKLVGASCVLLVLFPLSLVHLCLSWWTALLGFLAFSCFSVGAAGVAAVMLFLWWTKSILLLLHRLGVRFFSSPFMVLKVCTKP